MRCGVVHEVVCTSRNSFTGHDSPLSGLGVGAWSAATARSSGVTSEGIDRQPNPGRAAAQALARSSDGPTAQIRASPSCETDRHGLVSLVDRIHFAGRGGLLGLGAGLWDGFPPPAHEYRILVRLMFSFQAPGVDASGGFAFVCGRTFDGPLCEGKSGVDFRPFAAGRLGFVRRLPGDEPSRRASRR